MLIDQPKVFVGTMYCGESEFEECCDSINSQIGVKINHIIIKNKNEYDAHNLLWKEWSDSKKDYDIFIKIDADTIILRKTAFLEILDLFSNKKVTGVQILLHDYFTDSLIPGLNSFSNKVVFKKSKKRLFADHSDSNHEKVLKEKCVEHLAPIGLHCKKPHDRQSFHYGLHRKLKGQEEVLKVCSCLA